MTMPHLHNCPHSPEGWCLECVGRLQSDMNAAVYVATMAEAEVREWRREFPGHAQRIRDFITMDHLLEGGGIPVET